MSTRWRIAAMGASAVVVVAFLALMAWGILNNESVTSRSGILRVGKPAPDFTLPLLDGGELALSQYQGRPVVINFWASWCPPCRAEMPDFQEMWEEMRGEDVVFVGIALGESERSARAFAETTGVTYPLGLDETGRISRDYRVTSLPTTVLIDREGNESLRLGIANQGALRIFVQSKLNDG